MNGRLIDVSASEDSSIFAFSAASFRRCVAIRSADRSTPCAFLNSVTIQSMTRWSQSSPPRWVLPAVDLTSNTPSPISSTDTSNVPPPRSNTRIVWSFSLSSPYASDAAVGSLMMRSTSRPAISPASLVAWRCASSKYAGTVMTAWLTVSPRYDSASRFSFCRMRAEISWARYALPSTSIVQLVPMWRLTERTVRSGFVMAWRFATSPTSTSPVFEKATTDGVVREPSALGITTGSPASSTETTELVVPRSMPTALGMGVASVWLGEIWLAEIRGRCGAPVPWDRVACAAR